METDPVCRMAVEPQKAAARVEYEGKTYYFCSSSCHRKFTAHPEQYAMPGSGGDPGRRTHGHG